MPAHSCTSFINIGSFKMITVSSQKWKRTKQYAKNNLKKQVLK